MSDYASFIKAQREYENRTPPEAGEPCERHDWDGSGGECPSCEALREAYEEERAMEDYYERKYGYGEQDEPDFDRDGV